MVAKAGKGWVLAPSLVALADQVDRAFPNRDRKADGSIGDAAHTSRTSDHNPSGGFVLALDLTNSPAGGFDAHAFAEMLRKQRDPRIKYVISNGRMYSSYAPAWQWRPYTGVNAHSQHVHVSVLDNAYAINDTSPWFGEEDDLPYTEIQLESIVRRVLDEGAAFGYLGWAQTSQGGIELLRALHNRPPVDLDALSERIADKIPEAQKDVVKAAVQEVFADAGS